VAALYAADKTELMSDTNLPASDGFAAAGPDVIAPGEEIGRAHV